MKTVVGIDLGTQSLKVVFYDYEARETLLTTDGYEFEDQAMFIPLRLGLPGYLQGFHNRVPRQRNRLAPVHEQTGSLRHN